MERIIESNLIEIALDLSFKLTKLSKQGPESVKCLELATSILSSTFISSRIITHYSCKVTKLVIQLVDLLKWILHNTVQEDMPLNLIKALS